LGLLAPLALFLLGWWGSIPFAQDDGTVRMFALLGLAAGAAVDLTVLRKFIFKLFALPVPGLVCVGLFYSVMVFGFFMGFPLFNSVVGIVFCYAAARRCAVLQLPRQEAQKSAGRFNIVFLVVLVCLCAATAFLSLREPSITTQVKNMFGLPFEVTMEMIWAIILVGGTLLVLFQYITARLVADIVFKRAYGDSKA